MEIWRVTSYPLKARTGAGEAYTMIMWEAELLAMEPVLRIPMCFKWISLQRNISEGYSDPVSLVHLSTDWIVPRFRDKFNPAELYGTFSIISCRFINLFTWRMVLKDPGRVMDHGREHQCHGDLFFALSFVCHVLGRIH